MTNKMREERHKQSLSIYDLADMAGLTPGYVANLERGDRKNPTWDAMAAIAKALNNTVPEIFFPEE